MPPCYLAEMQDSKTTKYPLIRLICPIIPYKMKIFEREEDHIMEAVYLPGDLRTRIEDLMKHHKISQAQLAAKIGITESTLSRFLTGKVEKLGHEQVLRLARTFQVSTDFLLGLTEIWYIRCSLKLLFSLLTLICIWARHSRMWSTGCWKAPAFRR